MATSTPAASDAAAEAEARRLADLLALLVRMSGRSHRSIEHDLGFGSAFLSKILRGDVRLQTTHILRICEVLEIEPYHFFKMAYPKAKRPPGLLLVKVREAAGLDPVAEEDAALEEKIKRILRKLLNLKEEPEGEP
ncbi:MAG TPA: hypothetical protein DD490_14995 [Acidobacteria bacterium]|nr:hypothetical protein [Acidobacteriota bacterium]